MSKQFSQRKARTMLKSVVSILGGRAAAAHALAVRTPTITRWINGDREIPGPAYVALAAILRHVNDYREEK